MHKSIRYLLLMLMLASGVLHAQKTTEEDYASASTKAKTPTPRESWQKRLVFGGNLGGYLGNPTYLQLNPMVGYRTTDWWVNGIGVNYTYVSSSGYRENIVGGSIWTRAYILKSLIAHSEFQILQRNAADQFGNSARANVPVWLVGAGYNSGGGRLGLSAMILYDLIQDPNSPYNNPIIRIGGLFGF
jgi:hypothetical protein